MIKTIIVDDHKIFREGLQYLLSKFENIVVFAEAANGKQFLEIIDNEVPDLVLMDIDMPLINGIEATKIALKKYPYIKIIALSMRGDKTYFDEMLEAGAKGFVLKESGSAELKSAIENVLIGENYFSPELLRNVIVDLGKPEKNSDLVTDFDLTQREYETLKLICNGLLTKDIADKLKVSSRTIEGYKKRIMDKLEVSNTNQLIIKAIKIRLVKI
ncbi:MAG: response regulator transcription factor [Chloroflexia bacterium]|nr:response regulator transcription factor [Chloroflexia bacterium]